ncbi:MAG: hypothetical protein JWP74_47 [Marmoricola sp.]|nr:hypothetical protein [Marmoricola sp.]
MPSTFQAVGAVVVALLPGALYIWSFERLAGSWGISLSDRAFRFVGASAFMHAFLAPATYTLWATQRTKLDHGLKVSWWLWALALGYVFVPFALGSAVGWATRNSKAWARLFTGPDPAPRAWDYLFQAKRDGWIRMRLKSGVWIAGAHGTAANGVRSYTAGYPEPQDMYLAMGVEVDRDTGDFAYDENGSPTVLAGGLLVRWDEVEYLEYIDA